MGEAKARASRGTPLDIYKEAGPPESRRWYLSRMGQELDGISDGDRKRED
jgi:hypothetical protein